MFEDSIAAIPKFIKVAGISSVRSRHVSQVQFIPLITTFRSSSIAWPTRSCGTVGSGLKSLPFFELEHNWEYTLSTVQVNNNGLKGTCKITSPSGYMTAERLNKNEILLLWDSPSGESSNPNLPGKDEAPAWHPSRSYSNSLELTKTDSPDSHTSGQFPQGNTCWSGPLPGFVHQRSLRNYKSNNRATILGEVAQGNIIPRYGWSSTLHFQMLEKVPMKGYLDLNDHPE